MKYAAFLRGINVGGKNLLPMKDLAKMFEAAGCTGVRTYIQSGNVVFKAGKLSTPVLSQRIEKQILRDFGFSALVISRTADEMGKAISLRV